MSDGDPSWLDRTLFPFTSRFVDVGGHKVHYIDEGSGPILLMLHGNPTWSFLYRHLVRRLSPRFRCVALDYPGFGLSTAAPGYGYTPREHSEVVEGFVDALDLAELRIMVQDWGGPIGLGFAGRRPERVHSLVIGNSFAWPATTGMKGFSYVVGNPLSRWLIPAGTNRKLTEGELAAYMGPFPTAASRLPTWIFARQIREGAEYLREVEAGLTSLSDKPALIVWGDADGAFRPADRDRFAGVFPRHRVVDLPGAKHFIQENAPEEIASAVLDPKSELL